MLAYFFVLIAVASRFLPHPFSFTPVGAALLLFGARAQRKHVWFPLALLAGSDVVLTKLVYHYPLSLDHLATWAWYGAVLWLGMQLKYNARALRLAGAALAASISFFLISNFAVWAVWEMYPKTLSGLATCYLAALPFFRNTVASDLFFTALLFSIATVLQSVSPALAKHSTGTMP